MIADFISQKLFQLEDNLFYLSYITKINDNDDKSDYGMQLL